MVDVIKGDMFQSDADVLVNTVNCVGVMGKGIAKQFKDKYPEMFNDYKNRCKQGLVTPGVPYLYKDIIGTKILNFPTKDHWRGNSKLEYIKDGVKWIEDNYKKYEINSMAIPALGCGNGGLKWSVVGPYMYQELNKLSMDSYIYAPSSASDRELSYDFFMSDIDEAVIHNTKTPYIPNIEIKPEWIVIVFIIDKLSENDDVIINRDLFQRIGYILTQNGLKTDFTYEKTNQGMYSIKANNAINKLIAKGIIFEDPNLENRIHVCNNYIYDKSVLELYNSFPKLQLQMTDYLRV